MSSKLKFFFTTFVILCFVVNFTSAEISDKNFNIPIYIQTSAGIERASSDVIANALFNYNFEIKKMSEYVPDEKCSIRAEKGTSKMENETFTSQNKLNFNIPMKNDGPGQGSLTAQLDKKRLSLNFEVSEILETNADKLVFKAFGSGNLNKKDFVFDDLIVTLDKKNNKVDVESDEISIKNMDVNFIKWCGGQETEFYLITLKDKLANPRTLEGVQELLKEHPELIDAYESLRNPNNIALIPEFGTVVGALTILGAVGVFFFVRRR